MKNNGKERMLVLRLIIPSEITFQVVLETVFLFMEFVDAVLRTICCIHICIYTIC